jgi:hypothetical protein
VGRFLGGDLPLLCRIALGSNVAAIGLRLDSGHLGGVRTQPILHSNSPYRFSDYPFKIDVNIS